MLRAGGQEFIVGFPIRLAPEDLVSDDIVVSLNCDFLVAIRTPQERRDHTPIESRKITFMQVEHEEDPRKFGDKVLVLPPVRDLVHFSVVHHLDDIPFLSIDESFRTDQFQGTHFELDSELLEIRFRAGVLLDSEVVHLNDVSDYAFGMPPVPLVQSPDERADLRYPFAFELLGGIQQLFLRSEGILPYQCHTSPDAGNGFRLGGGFPLLPYADLIIDR